ncbi:hypothetical protein GAYE_PCTG32G0814 [Galdieria yellowstonensis]|uniref:J domain-containing protein n=1 Tax=Galdieria yellowstonensis TaxID=3028027 RepID=A0AAV9I3V9_9RHOD|nr:hypothetical protein GAYE_PCTG32G0814 [Galdieria yellowstonensis]
MLETIPSLVFVPYISLGTCRKRKVYRKQQRIVSARRLHSAQGTTTTDEELHSMVTSVNEQPLKGTRGESTPNISVVQVACQRYYGASGIWGSPFAGNRWKDAEAWIHHGSVYDWRGPGGPYSWTRRKKNNQQSREKKILSDWYAILDVPRNASLEEIKRAFRRRIIRIHPDVNGQYGMNKHLRDSVCELLSAYRVLRDPISRAEYDRNLEVSDGHLRNTSSTVVEEEQTRLPVSNKQIML